MPRCERGLNEDVMHVTRHRFRVGLLTLAIGLVLAPAVVAQSIVDARRIEFTPSADHDTVDSSGSSSRASP